MKSIRIQNLRCLEDTGLIPIRPITLLLGQNSSGKSTFLRTFPLLRQSYEARTTGPILWYGQYVDFGGFQDSLYTQSTEKAISFHFDLKMPFLARRAVQFSKRLEHKIIDVSVHIKIVGVPHDETSYVQECLFDLFDHKVLIKFDFNGDITHLIINECDFLHLCENVKSVQRGLIPRLFEYGKVERTYLGLGGPKSFLDALFQEIRTHAHGKTGDETIAGIAFNNRLEFSTQMLSDMQNNPSATDTWKNKTSGWGIENKEFITLRNLTILNAIPEFLEQCDEYLSDVFVNVRYVAPIRATAERYYRAQNLAVNEVDFQGRNLPMFLKNMSDSERKDFSGWAETLLGISPQAHSGGGHITLKVKEINSDQEFNLADMGFGYSQVLPILTQLWSSTRIKRTPVTRTKYYLPSSHSFSIFSIEQPELHLHPRLQAKLADIFCYTVNKARERKSDFQLLIETHSEALVNRLGHLIAKGELTPDDVNIVIFNKVRSDSPASVEIGQFDENGFLINWPLGFFDVGDI